MADANKIMNILDSYMIKIGKEQIGAIEANALLAKAGILSDSKDRPGKPLRELLRKGKLPHAYQNGREWVIPISSKNTRILGIRLVSDVKTQQLSKPQKQRVTVTMNNGISFDKFCAIASINLNELDIYGFYCIRLIKGKLLPPRYQTHLRPNRLIYIGKADGQTLRKRFYNQELNALGHGTFFRSIGAVLEYRPPKGLLANKKNQKNYKFSDEDTKEIIQWMRDNLEVSWIAFNGDFSIESQLIKTHLPLLNLMHNPKKLSELEEDRESCRLIACSPVQ